MARTYQKQPVDLANNKRRERWYYRLKMDILEKMKRKEEIKVGYAALKFINEFGAKLDYIGLTVTIMPCGKSGIITGFIIPNVNTIP